MEIYEGKKSLSILRCYSGNCLQWLRKTARIFSRDRKFPAQILKKNMQKQYNSTMKFRAMAAFSV
jgi:hypothetical protein